ncbi:helix-turn-helix domain-containing protein [Streptomyces griseorubiginosus]|uniref:helix-turn-helix domain-containing protein n=1 Tax=Streptomyces griseorubiginosus TaxID=67304 RepID=UPI0036EC7F40
MGRRENPIAPCERELEKLVRCLRDHRGRAGLNYRELAERSGCSASTLIRAASGEQIPKLKTVRAYAAACGADPDEAERLWKRARYRAVRDGQEPVPHPRYVRNFAELRTALADLYQKDGARPFRELEAASHGVLAHATVGRFLRQESGRPTRQFVRAFAIACGAKGKILHEWENAWDRAEEQRIGAPAVIAGRRASEVVLADGQPVYFHSDPERTPDGQEVRRITAAAQRPRGTLIKVSPSTAAKLAGGCPVCAQTTQEFTPVLPPPRSPQPVLRKRAAVALATGVARPRRTLSRMVVAKTVSVGQSQGGTSSVA